MTMKITHLAFPAAKILVANASIKEDVIEFSRWMETVGWLDKQPQMEPRSAHRPDGFDYDGNIEVMSASRLELLGGGVLEVRSDYPATECSHMTTVFIPELQALITSDLCYQGVHAWAGPGVLREHLANWIAVLGEAPDGHELAAVGAVELHDRAACVTAAGLPYSRGPCSPRRADVPSAIRPNI
jgi:hypothetical protein